MAKKDKNSVPDGFSFGDGGGEDGGGYGGSGDSDSARDPNCKYCKDNVRCPFIRWSEIDQRWYHQASGSTEYTEFIMRPGIGGIQETPKPGDEEPPKRGWFGRRK
jgi:hypothetical protein